MQSDLQRTAIGDCAASRVSIGRPPHCVNCRGVAGIPLVDLSEALSRMGRDPRLVGATALSGHPNDRCPSRLPIRRRSGPRGIRSGPEHWSARPWGRGGKRRCRPGVEAEGDRLVLRMPDLQAPGTEPQGPTGHADRSPKSRSAQLGTYGFINIVAHGSYPDRGANG
jgi:hypothetical protein